MISRRDALGALGATVALTVTPRPVMAQARSYPETRFRITMTVSPQEPVGLGVQHFIKLLGEKTGGAAKPEFFPNGQLGQDLAVFEQLSDGTVHMHASGFGINANYNSFFAPWAFTGFDHVERMLASDLAKT